MRMNGRVALVTGAGSGLGRAIALAYAREGARVAVADLDLAAAQRVADEAQRSGPGALAVRMDVTDEQAVEAGVALTGERLGSVDVLVSNAGIQHIAPLVDFPFEAWRKLLAVHLDGAFLTARACMRRMIAAGRGGSIVFMGSVHSVEASPLKSAYVAAKHGILGLSRAVAREGAVHRISSNVICPGFVRTPLVEKQIPEQARDLGISEFTSLEDVAELAVLLAAFPSRALTGQSLLVSHGWHMQ